MTLKYPQIALEHAQSPFRVACVSAAFAQPTQSVGLLFDDTPCLNDVALGCFNVDFQIAGQGR